jgi:hypothetical protein
MPIDKPQTAEGYLPEWVEQTKATCLYVATVLGDFMQNDLTIVGGLVPGLLISQDDLPRGADPHAGTMDLDIGLKLAILEEHRYREISKRLREAGFRMDQNLAGNPTRQRWLIEGKEGSAVIEFLIPPTGDGDRPGALRDIEADFAAIITPGLDLAFIDREPIMLRGKTILGEDCQRQVFVCGPAAFVVLKALAFRNRGFRKDAYDLYYVVRYFGNGEEDVANRFQPLLENAEARDAVALLHNDFRDITSIGTMRAAAFLGREDEELRQDIVGCLSRFVDLCGVII